MSSDFPPDGIKSAELSQLEAQLSRVLRLKNGEYVIQQILANSMIENKYTLPYYWRELRNTYAKSFSRYSK